MQKTECPSPLTWSLGESSGRPHVKKSPAASHPWRGLQTKCASSPPEDSAVARKHRAPAPVGLRINERHKQSQTGSELESIGICFRKSLSYSESGYFERRHDRLRLAIAEDLVRPDGSGLPTPSWQSPQEREKPSRYLTFSLNPDRYGSQDIQQWSETKKLPLEQLLAQVVAAIRKHFVEAQERREQEAVENAKRHAEWLQIRPRLDSSRQSLPRNTEL